MKLVTGSTCRVFEHDDFLKKFVSERHRLAAYLRCATGDPHAAEDLLQNVACVLWRKIGDYDERRPFGAWAAGIAELEVLKWRQQTARGREVISEEAVRLLRETSVRQAPAPEDDARLSFLADCVQALAQPARAVLQLKYGEGYTIQQIAGRLERTVAAIEMTLVRSRRALRDCIQRKMARENRESP